ncbi:transcription antitermination factor NusB [Candidatus Saccharibacteria bacterium]|nr:transcription antitermination factor NusB [Candidatus Saccharibacteria bacterium]
MASNRHLGRIIALQTLYEAEFRSAANDKSVSLDEVLKRNLERYDKTVEDKEFVKRLTEGVSGSKTELDAIIQPIAPEWPLAQIARIDLTILRMAVYELKEMQDIVPPKVAINEAVELAKAFGSDNSSKFVNGVLGTAYRTLTEEGPNADTKV